MPLHLETKSLDPLEDILKTDAPIMEVVAHARTHCDYLTLIGKQFCHLSGAVSI